MTDTPDPVRTRVVAIVVNFQTPDLLDTAVRSFKRFYPDVPLTIIDNGSRDDSPATIARIESEVPSVRSLYLSENVYHGPAMHQGLMESRAAFTYVFDSDTETVRSGFLEAMLELLEADAEAYGAGQVVQVDRRGFARETGIPVLASAHMLLKTDLYRSLPPFIHHGLPALANFRAAYNRGYRLLSWPIGDYVHHLGRGTAARYGYGLGLRAKLDYVLTRLGF